jgi:hypothetical protein
MSEGYAVEVAEELVGVVIREEGERHFTFFTAVKAFDALDGCRFRGPLDAERAARDYASRRKRNRPLLGGARRSSPLSGAQCVWSAHIGA